MFVSAKLLSPVMELVKVVDHNDINVLGKIDYWWCALVIRRNKIDLLVGILIVVHELEEIHCLETELLTGTGNLRLVNCKYSPLH